MATPLKWNLPGKKWNSGLKWNGLMNTSKTMTVKAIIDFGPYSAPELGPLAQVIHDKMTAHAATFTTPPTSMAALQALVTNYNGKLVLRASNSSDDVMNFNLARHDLEATLHDLGVYVNLVAKGDPAIVENSGFPSYVAGASTVSAIPAAPSNVVLRHGDLPGTINGRFKPDRQSSFNVAQTTTGDPNNEAGWRQAASFSGGRVVLAGFTTGSTVWARFATVGAGAVIGAWSDPAKIVVM